MDDDTLIDVLAELAAVMHGLATRTLPTDKARRSLRRCLRTLGHASPAPLDAPGPAPGPGPASQPGQPAPLPGPGPASATPTPRPGPAPDDRQGPVTGRNGPPASGPPGPGPAPPASAPASPGQGIGTVFDYWRKATGHERARLTPERARLIRARLGQGYTTDDIKRAIDGCISSAFHNEGGFDDLTLICRNGSKLEAFIARAGEQPALEGVDTPVMQLLKQEMKDARDAGDTKRWSELNARLRDISAAR